MSAIPPLQFEWSGEAMVPVYARLADRHYVIGQRYFLEEHREVGFTGDGEARHRRSVTSQVPMDGSPQIQRKTSRSRSTIRSGKMSGSGP